jgi:hypothetical protein
MGTMASLASRKIASLWLSPGARTRRSLSDPPFAAVQGRTLDPTLLPRLRNRRQVTRQ